MTPRRRGAPARAAVPLLLLSLGACAYFNGVYNAKEAQRAADRLARSGREEEAAPFYASAAEKAETVLTRYPRTRWRPDALYLSGRGYAFSQRCEPALPRLTEFLALPHRSADQRDRATLALGSCLVRMNKYLRGRALLDPLTRHRDRPVATLASLWASRASIALGDNDAARRYLAAVDVSAAEWELATASLEHREYARAESLFMRRAQRGDYKDEVLSALRELWAAGRRDAVEAIAVRYDSAKVRSSAKVRTHMVVATLQMDDGLDSLARRHLLAARRITTDTLVDREAAARLVLLAMARVTTLADAKDALERARGEARNDALFQGLAQSLVLARILERRSDLNGASLFLAAEVARDSLRAPRLAARLFLRIPENAPRALLAPRALFAAALLEPDSAETYRARVREQYASSPYALLLKGGDPGESPAYGQADVLLSVAWADALRAYGDSLQKLTPAPAPTMGATP